MDRPTGLTDSTSRLVLARDASANGMNAKLRTAEQTGILTRIRWGAYADAQRTAAFTAAERYRAQVLAAMAVRRAPIATGFSAAVLIGLPIIGSWPSQIYVLSATSRTRNRNGVSELARHGVDDVIETDGNVMTSVPLTLLHVCRRASFTCAVTMVDAALHVDRRQQIEPLTTLSALWACHLNLLPYPGSSRVAQILQFVTVFAESPLESFSRVVIEELGFPQPELQYPLHLPISGRDAFMDFGWPDYRVDGEADGRGKYLGSESEPVTDPAAKIMAEKRRDNEIRGQKWTPAHWEWDDVWHRNALRAILIEAGLPVVRRPRRLL